MYIVELMEDSPKGANSKLIASLKSNDPTELFNFIEQHVQEIDTGYWDYLITIILNYYQDKKKLTEEEKEEYKRLTAYNDALYYALNDSNEDLYTALNDTIYSEIISLAENKEICLYMLKEIDLYNIGINFKEF